MKNIHFVNPKFKTQEWALRHVNATYNPQGPEGAVLTLLKGWIEYAQWHESRYEGPITDDYYLGTQWVRVGHAIKELLNGDTGRLDCGTLSEIIEDTFTDHGRAPS